jgi:hypothetical protein
MGMNASMLILFEALGQNKMPKGAEIVSGAETPETIKQKINMNSGASKCKRANCCRKKSVV